MSQDKSFLTIHWASHFSVVVFSSLHTTLHLVAWEPFHLDKAEHLWDTCRFCVPCLHIFGGVTNNTNPTFLLCHIANCSSASVLGFWTLGQFLIQTVTPPPTEGSVCCLLWVISEVFKHPSKLQKLAEYYLSTITAVKDSQQIRKV